jgi:hypothetical protein
MYSLNDVVQEATASRAKSRTANMSQAELQVWMLEEANRLIDARKATERPARPVWTNRIEHPEDAKYDPERDAINDAAAQVAARLAKKDSADEDARW